MNETKIEEEPITGLLKFILEDLQRMELEKSKIVNEEIKEETEYKRKLISQRRIQFTTHKPNFKVFNNFLCV